MQHRATAGRRIDDRDVFLDAVVCLDLEAPPVGPHRRACAVFREEIGNLVSLDRVLEACDLVAHLMAEIDHDRHFVGTVTVIVDQNLAIEHAA